MPYNNVNQLPAEQVKGYSAEQKKAFMAAFNNAAEDGKSEASCFKIAHAAAARAGRGGTQ